ncbi:MAG: FecR domain-containing protein [Myxococcales bacterium]|nr:FecR domain-containing protein [Myxococcales bacterium]
MEHDEHVRAARRLAPAWNELREQRVLQRIQAEPRIGAHERPRGALFAIAAAAVLLVAFGWFAVRGRRVEVAANAPTPTVAPVSEAQVMLHDGSLVRLVGDARVAVQEQSSTSVRLTQTKGLARYEVTHAPARAFVVAVADAEVEVHGTTFTVELTEKTVKVKVVEGNVLVRGDGRAVKLTTGEALEVAAWRSPVQVAPSVTATTTATISVAPSVKPKPTVEALLAGADQARAEGRLDDAAEQLRTLVTTYPGDPRAASAWFTLGKVERGRGRHAAAAAAFAKVSGALAEDALAEEATSWKSAGDAARARTTAKRYLELHPKGLHAQRMLLLAE